MGLQQGWVAGTGPFFVDGQEPPAPPPPPAPDGVANFGLADDYVRPVPEGRWSAFWALEVHDAPAGVETFGLDDQYIRPVPQGEFEHTISFWEVTQPQAAVPEAAFLPLEDQLIRPIPGGEFDSWVSWWEVNQPAPGAPPDGVATFGLDDRIHRPYIPAESAFWWEKPTEVQTVPLGAWFPLPDEIARPIPGGEFDRWESFFEVNQPSPAVPELSWQGLRDELIRSVPRGEWDAVWYPLLPPAPPVDVFITEGDAGVVTGLEGDQSAGASMEGDAGVLVGIEG